MNYLNKIKSIYNQKLLDDHISKKNFTDAFDLLNKIKSNNPNSFIETIKNIENHLNDFYNSLFPNKKIIWLISFDPSDLILINKFLEYYFSKALNHSCVSNTFGNLISQTLVKLNANTISEKINFDQTIEYSNIFQNLILFDNKENTIIASTSGAFFEELNKKKYFINPIISQCYFYVVKNPIGLFASQKIQQPPNVIYQELFNQPESLLLQDVHRSNKYKFYENRQSWNINVSSWIDPNVLSTYRGKIIKYEDLISSPNDVFNGMIYHLKESGLEINLDYNLIDNFISLNEFEKNFDFSISNKEKKFLNKNLNHKILEQLEYKI